jgi:hypothetical protein
MFSGTQTDGRHKVGTALAPSALISFRHTRRQGPLWPPARWRRSTPDQNEGESRGPFKTLPGWLENGHHSQSVHVGKRLTSEASILRDDLSVFNPFVILWLTSIEMRMPTSDTGGSSAEPAAAPTTSVARSPPFTRRSRRMAAKPTCGPGAGCPGGQAAYAPELTVAVSHRVGCGAFRCAGTTLSADVPGSHLGGAQRRQGSAGEKRRVTRWWAGSRSG